MDDVVINKCNIKNLGHFKECRVKMNNYTTCDNHMNITCPLKYMYAFTDAYIGDLLIYTLSMCAVCIRKFKEMFILSCQRSVARDEGFHEINMYDCKTL